jgi:hypothetical protein
MERFFFFFFFHLAFISSLEKCLLQTLQIVMIPPHLQVMNNMDQDDLLIFQMMATRVSTLMICSIHIRWKNGGGGQSMDLTIGVQDVFGYNGELHWHYSRL